MPNDYACCNCSHQFTEDELITERGTFYSACPSCGSEDLKAADDVHANWPKPITVMPVSTFGLEQLARKLREPA